MSKKIILSFEDENEEEDQTFNKKFKMKQNLFPLEKIKENIIEDKISQSTTLSSSSISSSSTSINNSEFRKRPIKRQKIVIEDETYEDLISEKNENNQVEIDVSKKSVSFSTIDEKFLLTKTSSNSIIFDEKLVDSQETISLVDDSLTEEDKKKIHDMREQKIRDKFPTKIFLNNINEENELIKIKNDEENQKKTLQEENEDDDENTWQNELLSRGIFNSSKSINPFPSFSSSSSSFSSTFSSSFISSSVSFQEQELFTKKLSDIALLLLSSSDKLDGNIKMLDNIIEMKRKELKSLEEIETS